MERPRHTKRVFDLALAVPALVVLAPVMAVIAVLIRVRMGRPVLFRQRRPGLHGEPFTIMKFRTMAAHAYPDQPDGERITPLGATLRRWSLDELPELVCVVRGDMSLVGPRPLRMEYLERYSDEQARRHEVPPGLTGWAQIHGRNAQSWAERLALDVWYVDNRSLWLDVRIIARTALTVLSGRGISEPGHATKQPFLGSDDGGTDDADA